ncbi:class I SAM-dependent methyltransferase [Corynebacterium crudilactis]|uniref:SAM-dependent methyltransferase n=1 Tax=Corynebacterium crudilactis TaxID=1652495 RepID=A0A172QWE1_9CORY|nr:class I SAM-dependent methyltransferase [Corynebacterium crudilactis]ANE05025.1 SAM-dependent methyltransferase [Corynebacterium crudilactis]
MVALPALRRLATLNRSWGLLSDFKYEQTRPDIFYGNLALDTSRMVNALSEDISGVSLDGLKVLDVGGGPGYFARAFEDLGATYLSVEPDVGEMSAAGIDVHGSVRGSGLDLPFRSNTFDVVYSSNVAEHVSDPWAMGEEMLRVTRSGGMAILSYTIWLGPFGGHETGLWEHYVGGAFARDRYQKKHGRPPKNIFGESLFNVSCKDGLAWGASVSNAELDAAFPRYHPQWAWWMVKIPVLREFAVSNLVLVFKKH